MARPLFFGTYKTEQYRGPDGRPRTRIITPEMEKQRTLENLPDYKKPFFRGSSYGVEDEKRFLQSLGVQIGQPGTPAPAAPAPTPAPTFTPTPLTPTTPAPTITEPSQQNVDLVAEFKKQIEDLKASNQEALQSQASLFTEQAKKQEERLLNLQGQLGQQQERFSSELGQQQERFTNQYNQLAMASAAPRQQLGVRTATGSAGTGMQIAGRGISGAFGRKGMRISSLNLG